MRIAQVAPLIESVPPPSYGGTERVVSYLTEALVELGHDVTLFASGDSVTAATLVPCCRRALRLGGDLSDPLVYYACMMEWVAQRSDEFDIIHDHIDLMHLPLARRCQTPHVTTQHGRLDKPGLVMLYREFDDAPLVSISYAQRKPLPDANWAGNVSHGLPLDLYSLQHGSGDYLAYIGRISPEKGLDRAITIARRVGMPLLIAAKVDRVDRRFFRTHIKPLLGPDIDFIGEVDQSRKQALLGNALALLFQIDWPEPFGLAMIESLACGTPVIARRRGSIPEVIDEGVTGFVVETVDEAVRAVDAAASLDRRRCRAVFEQRFSAQRMARDYVAVYRRLLDRPLDMQPATRTAV